MHLRHVNAGWEKKQRCHRAAQRGPGQQAVATQPPPSTVTALLLVLKVQPVMGQPLRKIELQETGSPWLRVESVRLCHVGAFGVFARARGLDIMRAAPLGRADFNTPIESRGWREGRAVALWRDI